MLRRAQPHHLSDLLPNQDVLKTRLKGRVFLGKKESKKKNRVRHRNLLSDNIKFKGIANLPVFAQDFLALLQIHAEVYGRNRSIIIIFGYAGDHDQAVRQLAN
jgi:hypothetical protein